MKSRIRFVVAIGIASALGVWLLLTAFGATGATRQHVGPAGAKGAGEYRLNGIVAPGAPDDASGAAMRAEGLRFIVRDKENPSETIVVVYRGQVPDAFKAGREIVVDGHYDGEVFQGERNTLLTLCASKFSTDEEDMPHGDMPAGTMDGPSPHMTEPTS